MNALGFDIIRCNVGEPKSSCNARCLHCLRLRCKHLHCHRLPLLTSYYRCFNSFLLIFVQGLLPRFEISLEVLWLSSILQCMGNWSTPFNTENDIFSPLNACHIVLAEAFNQENATPKISSYHTEIFPRMPTDANGMVSSNRRAWIYRENKILLAPGCKKHGVHFISLRS